MTFIIATIIIGFSYSFFRLFWGGLFINFLFLVSSEARDSLGHFQNTKTVMLHFLILLIIPSILIYGLYFLFLEYDYGYAISALVGAVLSFGESLIGFFIYLVKVYKDEI